MHRGHVRCTGGAPQNGAQGAPKNPVHRGRFTRDLIAGRPMCTVLTRPLCTVFGAPRVHRILGAPCAPFKDAPCAPFLGAPCAPDFPRIRPLCTDFSQTGGVWVGVCVGVAHISFVKTQKLRFFRICKERVGRGLFGTEGTRESSVWSSAITTK